MIKQLDSSGISHRLATLLWAFAILFFLQLYTLFVESIYRLSLIKLAMGWELLGVLFLMAPLVVVLLGGRGNLTTPVAAIGLFAARATAPFLDVTWQIVASGAGVAGALVLICHAVARSPRIPNADPVGATALAVLASIVLRHIGWTTLDLSMETWYAHALLMMLFVVVAALWLRRSGLDGGTRIGDPNLAHIPLYHLFARSLVLFGSFTLIYLVAWSPAVTCAWSGGNFVITMVVATVAWTLPFYVANMKPPFLLVCNLLFVVLLIGGILANTVAFPASPADIVVVEQDRWWQHAPLYVALALSPVLAFNMKATFATNRTASIRAAAIAVFLGVLLMFSTTLMLIFTNVWGYVEPISPWFRNRFYFPFAVLGGVVLACLALVRNALGAPQLGRPQLRIAATVLAFGFLSLFTIRWAVLAMPMDSALHPRITVLTYNMQQGSDLDGNQRYIRQLKFMRMHEPDVVLLQESDTPRPSGGLVDAPRLFADALGMYLYYGPKTVTGTYGTAVLSRVPLENTGTVFTYSDEDEVGTAFGEIVWNGRRILLINNHPAGGQEVKHAHVDVVIDAVKATDCDAVIAGGDFNFRQNTPYYQKMAEHVQDTWLALHPDGIGDSQSVMTEPDSDPAWYDMRDRIDHIFVTEGASVDFPLYILPPYSHTDHPAYHCDLLVP